MSSRRVFTREFKLAAIKKIGSSVFSVGKSLWHHFQFATIEQDPPAITLEVP